MARAEYIEKYIGETEISEKIKELGRKITAYYKGEELTLVCILKGSVIFTADLARNIVLPVKLDFMSVSSYGSGTVSSGSINIKKDVDMPVEGKNILIVEDIVDSGRTLSYLVDYFKAKNPKSVNVCTLFDKPDRREYDVDVKWTGFVIPDEFIVGYGLDFDERYRTLPFVATLHFEDDKNK